jgi:hypothetical protein
MKIWTNCSKEFFFKIERSKCFSSYSHKKRRRMKNYVQISIRSLSISSDVFRIDKFVDNVLNLYQSSHALLFKRFCIDLYKRYINFFAIDEKTRWTCQTSSKTIEKNTISLSSSANTVFMFFTWIFLILKWISTTSWYRKAELSSSENNRYQNRIKMFNFLSNLQTFINVSCTTFFEYYSNWRRFLKKTKRTSSQSSSCLSQKKSNQWKRSSEFSRAHWCCVIMNLMTSQ